MHANVVIDFVKAFDFILGHDLLLGHFVAPLNLLHKSKVVILHVALLEDDRCNLML
jgi:hypothetical protein